MSENFASFATLEQHVHEMQALHELTKAGPVGVKARSAAFNRMDTDQHHLLSIAELSRAVKREWCSLLPLPHRLHPFPHVCMRTCTCTHIYGIHNRVGAVLGYVCPRRCYTTSKQNEREQTQKSGEHEDSEAEVFTSFISPSLATSHTGQPSTLWIQSTLLLVRRTVPETEASN
jgi:hypothetical protein